MASEPIENSEPIYPAGDRSVESNKQRLDRNLQELLAGLRVALPGVQVLFAFLLLLPFQRHFPDLDGRQEGLYFIALFSTALASILLIAPTARHRMRFRRGDKAYVVFSANRLAVAGLVCLGTGIITALLLVSDVIFGSPAAVLATSLVGAVLIWVWFGSPLARTLRTPRGTDETGLSVLDPGSGGETERVEERGGDRP